MAQTPPGATCSVTGERTITIKMKRTDAWRIAHALDQVGKGNATKTKDKRDASAVLAEKLTEHLQST